MKNGFVALVAFAFLVQGVFADSVATLAGTGSKGFSGDRRAATKAKLNNVYGVGRGPDGYLYFCDMDNARIRRVSSAGNIETYAGNGKRGFDGDGGSAARASLSMPYEMAWDQQGNLYVVDLGNHNVRRIDAKTRKISTIVGTGKAGFGGDGGPAAAAQLNQPHSLAFDAADNLYICDIMTHRIRRVDRKTGIISTWCGTGEAKTASDGSPIQGSPVHGPRAITFAADGTGYLALREGNAVLLLDPKKKPHAAHRGKWQTRLHGKWRTGVAGNFIGTKRHSARCRRECLSRRYRIAFHSRHRHETWHHRCHRRQRQSWRRPRWQCSNGLQTRPPARRFRRKRRLSAHRR